MNTILSFIDKLYSDSKTLSIVYIVGAILLFIFIILLMFSLRKKDSKVEQKIIEEPSIEDDNKEKNEPIINIRKTEEKEEIKLDNQKEEPQPIDQSIFERTRIIPLDELKEENNTLEQTLNNVEKNIEEPKEEIKEEPTLPKLSSQIPDVDEFVDNVVKKTYEKNEQFSSVYVGNNTSTIKLDKVLDKLNVDEEVKESIVPLEERTVATEEPKEKIEETTENQIKDDKINEEIVNEQQITNQEENNTSLINLKKALEEKKKEVNLKQDDLKAKLEGLKKEKNNNTLKAEELLNKLNEMKEK